jgi:hypothetical protein
MTLKDWFKPKPKPVDYNLMLYAIRARHSSNLGRWAGRFGEDDMPGQVEKEIKELAEDLRRLF